MVTIDYYLKCSYSHASQVLMDIFGDSAKSSLGNIPNFKYQYYVDLIWCDGFVFHLGKYTDYDKTDKSWTKLDMIRIEVNPNKHSDSIYWDCVLAFLREYCTDGVLIRYDYAIDVPVPLDDVLVINSRKERGLYRGTRYFGRRHKHGYLKIYDKGEESKESQALTRIEYTFERNNIPSFDNIVVRNGPSCLPEGSPPLSKIARLYLDMLIEIKALGGQIEPYMERIDSRTWKQIEPYLFSGIRLVCENDLIEKLLQVINYTFIISDSDNNVNDDADFVEFSGSLPWEE